MKNFFKQHTTGIFFALGTAVIFLFAMPYILLGENSYIPYHDQLDGEVLNYIYQAKYLLSGSNIIPEFMNGMAKSAMTLPAPLGVLFYMIFPPFTAFTVMHVCMMLLGFAGMFLLIKDITGSRSVALITGVLFAYLPFYPVYGLAIWGQPLLLWGFLQLYRNKNKVTGVLAIITYALFSSLALVGFAWIGFSVLASVYLLIFQKRERKRGLRVAAGAAILGVSYLVCNMGLLSELGGSENIITHRVEMAKASIPFSLKEFTNTWIGNGIYVPTCALGILLFAVLLIVIYAVNRFLKSKQGKDLGKTALYFKGIIAILILSVMVTLLGQMWNLEATLNIRRQLGDIFLSFQASRITWTLPVWWYIILGLCLAVTGLKCKGKVYIAVVALPILVTGISICRFNSLNENVRLILFPDKYEQITWADIYAEDVFTQISDILPADKSSYRVATIGMYPAAALYNGFYCLDGYSNNYALEYKHQFRKIISEELDKNEQILWYFDEWGNRCYLMTNETGYSALISKEDKVTIEKLSIDVNQFAQMGGRYIFSAVEIKNAEEENLTLVSEKPFSTEESFYEIWVYEVTAES